MASESARTLVEQAFRDRHLSRMVLTVQDGGIDGARARYEREPSAPLLIAELGPDDDLSEKLEALAEVCEPTTNLILLGSANDVETYRMLTRRGVGDYVVLPAPPARLVESVVELYQDPGKAPIGLSIAVIGVKGGCGASTIAHNLAYHLARRDDCDAAIMDFDLPFGTADLDFNIETANGMRNLLAEPDRIDDVFLQRFSAKYGERVMLFAAPATLDSDHAVDARVLETTIESVKRHAHYAVLDVPHVWTEWVRAALRAADRVVLVATPELASVRNTRNLVDFLSTTRPLEGPPLLVLNRVGANKKGEVPVKEFGKTVGLEPAVVVGLDLEAFGLAVNEGRMIEEVKGRSKAAAAIGDIAARVVPPKAKTAMPKKAGGLGLFKLVSKKA